MAALPRFSTGTRPADETALTTVSLLFLGMTAAVLAIVCLNLASMLMARGQARKREFAIRLALGGGRGRIVRQLLTEGLVLAGAGSVLGVAAGAFASDALIASLASRLPVSIAVDTVAWPAMTAGAVVFSVLATLLFALGPALRHSRGDLVTDLKRAAGEDARGRRFRLLPRHPLVSLQIALSLALLIASGLFLRMARQASQVDLGVRADATVLAEVDAGLAGYDEARGLDTYARVEERLRALPGVEAAAVGVTVPFGTVGLGRSVTRAGAPESEAPFNARWNAVGASYFAAMGIPVKGGRTFTDVEARLAGAPPVAVVDEVLARSVFPSGDALGQTITLTDRGERAGGSSRSSASCPRSATTSSTTRRGEPCTCRSRRRTTAPRTSTCARARVPPASPTRSGARSGRRRRGCRCSACSRSDSTSRPRSSAGRSTCWRAPSRPWPRWPRWWRSSASTAPRRTRCRGGPARSACAWRWGPRAAACWGWWSARACT